MSAGEVRENYDAIRESMEMWDENGELQGGTQSRMVDRQAPGTEMCIRDRDLTCTNAQCANHGKTVEQRRAYLIGQA